MYQGSVIVEFFVQTEPEDEEPQKTLEDVQRRFIDAVVNGNMNLGAPIIDTMSDGRVIKTDYVGENTREQQEGNIWDDLVNNNTDDFINGDSSTQKDESTGETGDTSTVQPSETTEKDTTIKVTTKTQTILVT